MAATATWTGATMTPVAFLLFAREATGSFASAGLVLGALTAGGALLAPTTAGGSSTAAGPTAPCSGSPCLA